MDTKAIILYDSPEAASYQCWEGWVSRDGRFWGANEHLARLAGCTHKTCAECGTVNEVSDECTYCRDQKMASKFAAFPVEKWDGETPLCLFGSDRFFFRQDILDWLPSHPGQVYICKCRPGYLSQIEPGQWADDLPEGCQLPGAVVDALAALNAAIAKAGPCYWQEDTIAIDVEDLRRRV